MSRVKADITMSIDGFVAGPDASLDDPLGAGGLALHEWAFQAESWRQAHGLEGGEANVDSEVIAETVAFTGATIMGRKMFSGGSGPWEDDPNGRGWWGDDPPFHVPVFVLTHHAREPLEMHGDTTFHFVTEGIDAALEQARAAAEDRGVAIAGGGSTVDQFLTAGVVDELQIHVAPMFLGSGVRLFSGLRGSLPMLELESVRHSELATHLKYTIA